MVASVPGCDARRLEEFAARTERDLAVGSGSNAGGSPAPTVRAAHRPPHPKTFREAKTVLREFYAGRDAATLYSACALKAGAVDWSRCCLSEATAHRPRVEWEHVVPAAAFGGALPEWREGHTRCSKRGRPFRGRKCARRTSREFQAMEGDMHNLFPEIGDVNGARGDTPMGPVPTPDGRHADLAGCGLRFGASAVEPRGEVRGDVARAYLYMAAAYPTSVTLSDDQRAAFVRWHEQDPPDDLERARNRRIFAEQGNENPWLE